MGVSAPRAAVLPTSSRAAFSGFGLRFYRGKVLRMSGWSWEHLP